MTIKLRHIEHSLAKHKGLVIFNPAVGGWSRSEGVKNIWSPALEEVKNFYISFEGG